MEITLPDSLFTAEDKVRMSSILKFELTSEEQWRACVTKLAMAALEEYKQMILGRGLPGRADEIREYRLYYLIKNYFETYIPDEATVSTLFQLTDARSKNLLKNTRSRFQQPLSDHLENTLRALIADNEAENDGECLLVIQSDILLEELNTLLARNAPKLDPIKKVPNTSRTYRIKGDSYDKLKELLGLVTNEAPEVAAPREVAATAE